jgi:serine protease Do
MVLAGLLIAGLTVVVALSIVQSFSLRSPFRGLVLEVSPAVVNIAADKVVRVSSRSPNELDDFLQREPESRPVMRHQHLLGSGFIFDARGYVLTNYHVISGYDEIVIRLADGREFTSDSVRKVGVDPWSDLAVLKIETGRRLPVAKLGNSDVLNVGDWVAAIGNPFGLSGTVTGGVVSAFNRSGIPMSGGPQYQDFIQTDASINPGNSGGPLVDDAGDVVGVNSGIRSPVRGNVGIGFAIPINFARAVAEELIRNGRIVRGYFGVSTQPIDEKIQAVLNLRTQEGVLVSSVDRGGPGDLAGVRPGDAILRLDNEIVTDIQQFQTLAAGAEPGRVVELEVRRWGKSLTLKLRVAPRVDAEPKPLTPLPTEYWLGLRVRNQGTLPVFASKTGGVPDAMSPVGVVVDLVEPGGPADNARIALGDIVMAIDDSTVTDAIGYSRLAKLMARTRKPLLFHILHGRQAAFVAVEPQ